MWLADGWNEAGGSKNGVWQFSGIDGIFTYSAALSKGEHTQDLVAGVELLDSVNSASYKNYKLQIVAQAVQA